MQQVLTIVAPVFVLIALGYSAGRFGWLSRPAAKGLSDFTFKLAIPAMLFRAMATAELPGTRFLDIWGAYFGAAMLTWALATLLTTAILRRPATDAPAISMSSGFGNVVMMGIPLALALYGDAATAPVAIIVSMHTPLLWFLASTHVAVLNAGKGAGVWELASGLIVELSRNMIILAILAGTAWRLTGLDLHPILLQIIGLLGQAGIPCALTALGLSLVSFDIRGQAPTLGTIVTLKLAAMPAIAWILATRIFGLEPVAAGVIVLFAAMPTGANAFLFAERQGTAVNSASGAVALGTLLAAVTASGVIVVLTKAA